jgi:beta-lactamase regulating signal transducer with metallopeptidase domain
MIFLLEYFVKASVIILATAAALSLGGGKLSAAARHLICALGISGLLALPVLPIVLPSWSPIHFGDSWGQAKVAEGPAKAGHSVLTTGPAQAAEGPANHLRQGFGGQEALSRRSREARADLSRRSREAKADGPNVLSLNLFVLLIYAGGVLLLTTRLLVDQFHVRRLVIDTHEMNDPEWQALFRTCAIELGVSGHVRLLSSRDRATPMAVGIGRRAIVLPASADRWSDEMRRAVLRHELAHIARRDCLTQTAAAFVCALYWVHPGSWWLARRLRIERELACDDRVLSAGTDADEYAGHLLDLAYAVRGHLVPSLAVGMAAPRQLETRMLALLDRARNRAVPTRRGLTAAFAIVAVLLVPVAAVTTVQPASETTQARDLPGRRASGADWYRRLLSADYWRQAAIDGLARLADQAEYLREMRQLGYAVVDGDVLFRLRQRGITPDFVRELAAEGLPNLSTDDLLVAVNHGIDPEYVRDLKGLGYWPLDMKMLTMMRSHGIDGDFVRELRTFGYRWSIDELVQARSHGVDPDFLLALSSLGYDQLTLDELTLLRSHGVTPMRIRTANQRAGTRLSVDQLTTLASLGWKP